MIGLVVFITLSVIGLGSLLNWPKTKRYLICFVNWTIESYLNYKYRDFHIKPVDYDYYISQIIITSSKYPHNSYVLPTNNKICVNLKNTTLMFKCNELWPTYQWSDDTILFIFYIYGNNEYIIPYQYHPTRVICLPIFEPNDLDTCMKIEYEKAWVSPYDDTMGTSPDSDVLGIISKYAGPKGNFHYSYPSSLIYKFTVQDKDGSIKGQPLINETECLNLTTMMGTNLTYTSQQNIDIIDNEPIF